MQSMDDDKRIGKYLMRLGIFPDLKGYKLIIKAIQRMQIRHFARQTEIQAALSAEYGITPESVFRNIAYAIGSASIANTSAYSELIGRHMPRGQKPTNSRFLATVVEALRLGLDEKVSA